MLVGMRKRGDVNIELQDMMAECGVDIGSHETVLNINKEKMSAEFKDCHLYLTYLRLGYIKFQQGLCMFNIIRMRVCMCVCT